MKNSFKNKFLIVSLLFSWSLTTEAQWTEKSSKVSPDFGIYDLTAPNLKTAYGILYERTLSFEPHKIVFTHDGGKTWHDQKIDSLLHHSLGKPAATSSSVVHVIGWNFVQGGGDMFRSQDGGQTWQREGANAFTDPASFPDDVIFFNEHDGVVFGDPVNGSFEIYTTNNGGDNWNQVAVSKIPEPLPNEYGFAFTSDKYGKTAWMATIIFNDDGSVTTGRLLRSDNKGKTWYAINSSLAITGGDNIIIRFRDYSNGLYKNGGILYRTTDGGATWTEVNYTGTFFNTALDNVPGVPGCWVSVGGEPNVPAWSMYGIGSSISYDDGNSWMTLDTAVNHTSIEMVNKYGGFSGGISAEDGTGGVFVYTGAPFKVSTANVVDACAAIEMNIYPNPSSESFSLTVNASSDETRLLRVYNMQGILMMTEKFNPAEVLYFGDDLSPGLYLAEIFVGNEKQVMRLLKQ